MQDLEETAPEARLGFVMQALDREVQLQVARLSVFPLAFAEDDACAVLRTTTKEAATLLSELYGHGLVQFNTVANGYVMHLSIRQQAAALPLAGSSTIAQSQVALVRHMAEQVARWTRQFITPAANLAVSLAKKNARNLEEAWRLVLAVPGVQQECWLQMASNMDGGLDVLYAAGAWPAVRSSGTMNSTCARAHGGAHQTHLFCLCARRSAHAQRPRVGRSVQAGRGCSSSTQDG